MLFGARATALTEQVAASSDSASALASLSASDRALVREYLTLSRVDATPKVSLAGTSVAAASGCWQVTWAVVGKDVFGFVLWQYNQQIYNWCGNGSTITVAGQVTRWASNMAPFWQYSPLGNIQQWGGVGYTYQRAYSQGQMALCIPPGGCEQYQYPWINQIAYPNGTVGGDEGA